MSGRGGARSRFDPSPEQVAVIVRRYRAGETPGSIAADFPVGRQTIARVVRDHGAHQPRKPGRQGRFTDGQKQEMADRYAAGASTVEVAGLFSCHNAHVSYILIMLGVEMRPQGRPPKLD